MNFRRLAYLQLQRLIGSRVDRAWSSIQAQCRMSADAYQSHHRHARQHMLTEASQRIPFYSRQAASLDPSRLDSFPVLTKQHLLNLFRDLMSDRLREEYGNGKPRGYGWVEVRSGGTTGVPVAVIHGPDFRDHDRALRMLQMTMCGFPFGTPYFRLWGSMNDINQMKDSRAHQIMSWLANEHVLNAFQMEPSDMDRYLAAMQSSRIRHMMAYVDAATQLAHHARAGGKRASLASIMACAGTVTEESRTMLHDVFGANVHNKYGSRDAGEMSCECAQGSLHILPGVEIEVVDEQGQPCASGVSGRLLITCLHNRDFPIIRYEIGDVGALATNACACGLPFPSLERLEGRTAEFLRSTTGGFITPVYIRHVIGVVHPPPGLRRYQLTQTDENSFTLALEREAGVPPLRENDTKPLRRDLIRVLGPAARLSIFDVDHIPESASGKFQYVINRAGNPR